MDGIAHFTVIHGNEARADHVLSPAFLCKLLITKGWGARAKMIEGPNAFAPTLCFA